MMIPRVYAGIVLALSAGFSSIAANQATAEQVSLTVPSSNIQIDGDLRSFDGEVYIVTVPDLGDMQLSADGTICDGPGCPELIFKPGADVTLTSLSGGSTVNGTIVDFADGLYSVQTALNVLTMPADMVNCAGPGCPTLEVIVPASEVQIEEEAPAPTRRAADLVMVGSDNVGEDLMPLVLEPFAELLKASSVSEAIEFPDDIAQFVFTRNDGTLFVLEIESNDSDIGINRLIEGTADIAMSSGDPEPEQIAALAAQGRGNMLDASQEYIVGVDSVLMTVHKDNPVDALSRQELIRIYRDQITDWSEVGGPDLPIAPAHRDEGSARRNFELWAFGGPSPMSPLTTEVDRGRDMRDFVEQNIGAIGYSISDNIGDTKAVDLILDCGVVTEATAFKTKAEEYLLNRRIRLYIDNQNRKPEVQQLVDFMISPAADEYVAESGYFSLGLIEDDLALERLTKAALIGQPREIGLSVQNDVATQLSGASRLSLTIRFATGQFSLDSKAQRDLDRLVDYMSRPENAGREFIFVGFADTVGQYVYNTQLSRNRAEQVLQQVRSHPNVGALTRIKLSTVGLSEAAPVSCNDNDYGRSRNRRVEVWVR